jgi:hypothetical protein
MAVQPPPLILCEVHNPTILPERFNWIRRACLIFLRKGFAVRSLQIHGRICSRLTPRAAQESAAQPHPSHLNRAGLGSGRDRDEGRKGRVVAETETRALVPLRRSKQAAWLENDFLIVIRTF